MAYSSFLLSTEKYSIMWMYHPNGFLVIKGWERTDLTCQPRVHVLALLPCHGFQL